MGYQLNDRLVVGIASSALFDLSVSDAYFRRHGQKAYSEFQKIKRNETLPKGVAFPFIQRLLSLNDLNPEDILIEVIIISKNDPSGGLRIRKSIEEYELPISRGSYLKGDAPEPYIKAYNCELFLSADERDVRSAIAKNLPAGQVLPSKSDIPLDETDELRVAFDFDGVLADDASEQIFAEKGLSLFHANEQSKANEPLQAGPLAPLMRRLSDIQKLEEKQIGNDRSYKKRLKTSIVTARNSPADERVINTLESWGVDVDQAHFLGGIEKATILDVTKPHIFFDDQKRHLEEVSENVPSVHIPFGKINIKEKTA